MSEMTVFTLGTENFEFPSRGIRFTKSWKDKHIRPLISVVYEMENINLSTSDDGGGVGLSDVSGLLNDIRPLVDQLVDIDELIVNGVIEWLMPEGDDRDYLLDEVSPRHFMAPLKWIVSEIYPLAELQRMISGVQPGNIGKASNSPSLNGAGAKKRRPKKK